MPARSRPTWPESDFMNAVGRTIDQSSPEARSSASKASFAFWNARSGFWTQMADVEGNEFCVLRGPGDGWEPGEL